MNESDQKLQLKKNLIIIQMSAVHIRTAYGIEIFHASQSLHISINKAHSYFTSISFQPMILRYFIMILFLRINHHGTWT